jgi:hypothetical protein
MLPSPLLGITIMPVSASNKGSSVPLPVSTV